MSTLYIRSPSKAAADNAPHWIGLPCPFALVAPGGAITQEGVAALSDLSEMVGSAQRVVLLIAASDVSLLRVKVPPLSASRLKAALPNLVEDRLISDPAESVIVAGDVADGLRTIAAMQRGWLDILSKTLLAYGARNIAALPAQLCLPSQPDRVTAAVTELVVDIELTLRLSAHDGIGLPIMPEHPQAPALDVVQALYAVVPQAPITLYVPPDRMQGYRDALGGMPEGERRIGLSPDNWSMWIAGAKEVALNLMAGLDTGSATVNWRAWRWPLVLAGALLLVNIAGLNIDWWRMRKEAAQLRAAMVETYKSVYPKEPVIIDPIAQMQQKIAAAQRASGQSSPDDFVPLAAGFGEAWSSVAQDQSAAPAIAAIEYRDRSLFVRPKAEGNALAAQLKPALAARNLSLTEPKAGIWQIRSAR